MQDHIQERKVMHRRNERNNLSRRILLSSLLVCAVCDTIQAQNNQTITDAGSPPAVGAGLSASSYALSNLDSVDPFSGSVYIKIPLLTVGGRGTISYPLYLELQNKWTLKGNVNNNAQVISTISGGVGGLSPWHPLIPGVVISREAVTDSNGGAMPCSGGAAAGYSLFYSTVVTKVTYVDPAGSEHEMLDTKTNGQSLLPYTTPNCGISPQSGTDRGRVFRADDASDIVFIADNEVIDQIAYGTKVGPGNMQHILSGWVLFPDGHKQRVDSGATTSLVDRNGNQISVGSTITDPLGRTVNIANNSANSTSGTPITLSYSGADNQARQIVINYASLSTLTPGQTALTYPQLFPKLNPNSVGTYNPYVPSSIVLPDQTSYQFTYTDYGEVASIKLPTGGRIVYDYPSTVGTDCTTACSLETNDENGYVNGGVIVRRLLDRKEYSDVNGAVLSHETLYSPNYSGTDAYGPTIVTVTEQDGSGNILQITKHHFLGNFTGDAVLPVQPWYEAHETLTETLNPQSSTLRQQLQTWTQRPCGTNENCWYGSSTSGTAIAHDPQICQKFTILADVSPAQSAATLFTYDQYNNVTGTYEYDYGAGPAPSSSCRAVSSGWTRHTQTSFLTSGYDTYSVGTASPDSTTAATSPYVTSLMTDTQVLDPNKGKISEQQITYDGAALTTYSETGHSSVRDGSPMHGNPTSIGNWLNTTGTLLTTRPLTTSTAMFYLSQIRTVIKAQLFTPIASAIPELPARITTLTLTGMP